jgi:hypothetical protein
MAHSQHSEHHAIPLVHLGPWRSGGAGGAIASLLKFLATSCADFVSATIDWDFVAVKILVAFAVSMIGFTLAGGVVAYFMQAWTQSRWLWFLLSLAIASGGLSALTDIGSLLKRADIEPISSAYAQTENQHCDDLGNFTVGNAFTQYLGISAIHYRVVVGSFRKWDDAVALATKINNEDTVFHATVADRAPCNDYYPVIVGTLSSSLGDAKSLLSKVQKTDF